MPPPLFTVAVWAVAADPDDPDEPCGFPVWIVCEPAAADEPENLWIELIY